MSILISGISMPEDKAIAVVIHPDGTAYSAEMFAGVCAKYLTDCEAVPVPPHGRLIDADALEKAISKNIDDFWRGGDGGGGYYLAEDAIGEVRIAPTIIQASKEDA